MIYQDPYFVGKGSKPGKSGLKSKNNPMFGVRLCGKDNPMFGKSRPDLAERNKSEEQREAISKSKIGKPRPDLAERNKKLKGKKLSEEHKTKISKGLKGKCWVMINNKRIWFGELPLAKARGF